MSQVSTTKARPLDSTLCGSHSCFRSFPSFATPPPPQYYTAIKGLDRTFCMTFEQQVTNEAAESINLPCEGKGRTYSAGQCPHCALASEIRPVLGLRPVARSRSLVASVVGGLMRQAETRPADRLNPMRLCIGIAKCRAVENHITQQPFIPSLLTQPQPFSHPCSARAERGPHFSGGHVARHLLGQDMGWVRAHGRDQCGGRSDSVHHYQHGRLGKVSLLAPKCCIGRSALIVLDVREQCLWHHIGEPGLIAPVPHECVCSLFPHVQRRHSQQTNLRGSADALDRRPCICNH